VVTEFSADEFPKQTDYYSLWTGAVWRLGVWRTHVTCVPCGAGTGRLRDESFMYAPPIGYDAKVAPGSVPGPTARRPLPGWSGIRSERMAASAAPARTMRIPPLRSAVKMES